MSLTISDEIDVIAALITLVGIVMTSVFLCMQIILLRKQVNLLGGQILKAGESNAITAAALQAGIIINFDEQFYGKRMRECRINVSQFLLKHRNLPVESTTITQWDTVSDLLDFFQGLATFTKMESLSTELVYKNYYYWFSFYYPACSEYIKYYQNKALIYAKDAEWLFVELTKIDAAINNKGYSHHTDSDFTEFFEWEIDNMRNYGHLGS